MIAKKFITQQKEKNLKIKFMQVVYTCNLNPI